MIGLVLLVWLMVAVKITVCIYGIRGVTNNISKTLCWILLIDSILGFLMSI